MQRFVIFTTLMSCICAMSIGNETSPWNNGRLVNGVDTTIEHFPYQVSIQTVDGFHSCGGSLLNEDTIVTAAHCMKGNTPATLMVRLGSTDYSKGGELVNVRALRIHPKYNDDTKVYDAAVMKLGTPVRQTAKVRYISLSKTTPPNGTPAVVTGWGTKCFILCASSKTLQMIDVKIVDEKQCASSEFKYGDTIKETMICAYEDKKDACQGDSGGPMVANGVQVGIVSFGTGCAWDGYPGIYCDVATVRDWLLQTAAEL